MRKTLSNLEIEGKLLNLMKSKEKITAGKIQMNGETLESFTLRS